MYIESDFFDQHDPNTIQEPIDGPSQTATNCSGIVATMATSSKNSLEENLRLSSFSIEELSHHNHSDEGGTVAAMGIDLEQQIGFDLEREYNSQLMQEVITENHPPPAQQPSWDEHQQYENQQIGIDHNLQCFNSAPYTNSPYAPPDLLNLLHLPRCSAASNLPNSASISVNGAYKKPTYLNPSLDIFGELQTTESTLASTVLYDSPLQLNFPPQPPVFRDIFNSLPHNYGLPGSRGVSYFGGLDDREANVGIFQEDDNSVLDFSREIPAFGKGETKGIKHFATERQRRQQLNEKFDALRSLVPNPTKPDRASIVGDATEHIKELLRTVDELRDLVDKKRRGRERSKILRMEEEAAADMESSSMKPLSTVTDREQSINGSLRSSWLIRKSKEIDVDVRIVHDEVTIKLTQHKRKKMNCLLLVAKSLHELQLELIHVAGGNMGEHYIFIFNTKIGEGSSVYASAIAKKLIEVLDRQCPQPFAGSFQVP